MENKQTIIGFTGPMKVGKTTTAEVFVDIKDFLLLSYATPVKKSLSEMTGLPMKYFTDQKLKQLPIEGLPDGLTPRQLMQKFATDFVRETIYWNFWIWRMERNFLSNKDRNIVIDDIRFENEAQSIRKRGGVIVHLKRDNVNYTEEELEGLSHSSESGIEFKAGDMLIENAPNTVSAALAVCSNLNISLDLR